MWDKWLHLLEALLPHLQKQGVWGWGAVVTPVSEETMGRISSPGVICGILLVKSPALVTVPWAAIRMEETWLKSGIWEAQEWYVETSRLGVINRWNLCLFTLWTNKNSFQSLPEQPQWGNRTQVYIPLDFPSRISQVRQMLFLCHLEVRVWEAWATHCGSWRWGWTGGASW